MGPILLIVLVLAGLDVAASWETGRTTEQRIEQAEQQILQPYPNLAIVSRSYQRGIFGATEDVTYGFTGNAQRLPAGLSLDNLRLTLHNDIHHGPLPQLKALALATVDTRVLLPAGIGQNLASVLHGQPILQVHSTVGFNGVSVLQTRSPAFQYRSADGVAVSWGGLTGSSRVGGSLSTYEGTLDAPKLMLDGPKGHLELQGLTVSGNMQRVLDTFFVGTTQLHLSSGSARPISGNAVSITGLSLNSDSALTDGYLGQHITLGADQLDTPLFTGRQLQYAQSFSHLDATSLAALVAALRDAQRQAAAQGPASDVAQTDLAILSRFGPQLAIHDPVIQIDKAGFVTPDGQLQLSARFAIPGVTQAELQGPLARVALLQHLDVSADLRVDTALLEKLLDASGRRAQVDPQLQQMKQLGYLRQDGNALTTSVTFHAGRLLINGQGFPPSPAAILGAH